MAVSWMNESFKKDKRYLNLQLKRGHIKRKNIDAILSALPDVSSKAMVIERDAPPHEKAGPKKHSDHDKKV